MRSRSAPTRRKRDWVHRLDLGSSKLCIAVLEPDYRFHECAKMGVRGAAPPRPLEQNRLPLDGELRVLRGDLECDKKH